MSLEYNEGFDDYLNGQDAYTKVPYATGTQEYVDYFAGWIAAKEWEKRDCL